MATRSLTTTHRLPVLLIDHNPADRALSARELRRELPDLEVREVENPETLAEALAAGPFAAAVTNDDLGWSTGMEVLRRLRLSWPETPVLMLTGSGNEGLAVAAMKAGLDAHLPRNPPETGRLAAAVLTAMERARTRSGEVGRSTQDSETSARSVAHDLNNLLAVIVGYAQMLRSEISEGDRRLRRVEQIERAAQRATELTQGLVLASRGQAPGSQPTLPSPDPESPPRPRPTILVVEDEAPLREMICEILQESDYAVLEAADPATAVQRAAEFPGAIDLMVSDVVMPGGTGPELAERIQASRPGVRVVFMSGYSAESMDPARLAPGTAILTKPFSTERLLVTVSEALGLPE
jgi:CheY-like chemotaxis protein